MKILDLELKELKIDYPCDTRVVTQGFSKNANTSYSRDGLLGHPAIDFGTNFDDPIYSVTRGDGYIYKIFNRDNPDLNRYRAVCELLHLKDYTIEFTYGHCNCIYCQTGQTLLQEKLASSGNTGEVYSGGRLVTSDEKLLGSKAGTHLHFQMRKCRRVTDPVWNGKNYFLLDDNGLVYFEDGYCFEYDKDGYNGCIDPMPYFKQPDIIEQQKTIIKLANIVIDLLNRLIKLKK